MEINQYAGVLSTCYGTVLLSVLRGGEGRGCLCWFGGFLVVFFFFNTTALILIPK